MLNRPSAREWFVPGDELSDASAPRIDFQMHTRWTDGRSSVREMIAAAIARDLEAIAITEHVNETSHWYPRFVAQVRAEREREANVAVYFGAEIASADYRGGLKADPARLGAELVVGVVHRLPKQDGSGFWVFEELHPDDAVDLEIKALEGLAGNRSVDVIGHPGGTSFGKFGPFPVERLEPVFRAAREHEIAIELNTKYIWDRAGMLALLRRIGPLVSFASDAHEAGEVGSTLESMRQLNGEFAMPAAKS